MYLESLSFLHSLRSVEVTVICERLRSLYAKNMILRFVVRTFQLQRAVAAKELIRLNLEVETGLVQLK